MEPSAATRATFERPIPQTPIEQLQDLLASAGNPPADWADRLSAIRKDATEIGLWDEDCKSKVEEIAHAATDQELEQLQKDVTAGRLSDWDGRLLEIRSHARAESVWSSKNEGQAHAIALIGMDGDLRAIDGARDAASKKLLIDIAHFHGRTARSYGVDVFSDASEGRKSVQAAFQYRGEAADRLKDAGRALAGKDLPTTGYKVGEALQSGIDANASFLHGARLMITDKKVLPVVAPVIALGKWLVD
jgi:hypothetical protein